MKSFETASADIQNVRKAMNGRIGEIISAVIGDDTLKTIFEQPENNEKYIELNQKGTPSGIIALDLGIIDAETKNALLLAQAAERTALNAERAQEIAKGVSAPEEWEVDYLGDIFKFVGSDRDPKILQEAQATWQLSQINLNTAIHDARITQSNIPPSERAFMDSIYVKPKQEHTDSLLKAASNYYAAASAILGRKGFEDAATKLKAVAQNILPENAAAITMTPHDMARAYTNTEIQYRQEMLKSLGSDHYTNDNLVELGEKLSRLTEGQKPSAPAVDTAPRKDNV